MAEQDEEDEMDFPSLDDVVKRVDERKKAEDKARKFAEVKAKIAAREAAARAEVKGSDSDSDLEISGAPGSRGGGARSSSIGAESPRLSKSARKIRDLNGPKWGHHAAPVTESQLDRAAHTFGANLGEGHHILFGAAAGAGGAKPKRPSAAKRESAIGRDELNASVIEKVMAQNHAARLKSDKKARAREQAQAERGAGGGLQAVDMGEFLKTKQGKLDTAKERGEDRGEGDDESADEDYVEGYALESDIEVGSGTEGGRGSGEEEDGEDEGGSGSEKENDDPNEPEEADGDKENRKIVDDEDDEEETSMLPPAPRRRAVRVLQSDDEDDTDVATTRPAQPSTPAKPAAPVAAGRIELPDVFGAGFGGADDGGFSQFFDGGLSQEDAEAGFRRPSDTAGDDFTPQRPFMNPVNISEAERLADAQQLEAQAVFRAGATPATPREAEPPRQYINKHGYMTQTRPVDLYDDSPGGESQTFFSETRGAAGYSQTQQTPTAKGRRSLGRLGSLLSHRESSELDLESTEAQPEPTELEPTVMESTEIDHEADEDVVMDDLALPSAAQPQTNAFEMLKTAQAKAAALEEKRALRRSKNAFIEAEADLSEDELLGGLAGLSGDENEDGLDAELESLVDNDEVDRDLQDAQDVLARERHQEELAKTEAAELARAQRVADGRERERRRNGGVDLSDDDFDDDEYGQSKRDRNKARAENRTIAELHADEETQAFASNFNEGLVVPVDEGQYSFLAEPASEDESEEGTDAEDEREEEEDADAAASRKRLTAREADKLAVEESRKRKLAHLEGQAELERQDEAKRQSLLIDTDEEDDLGLGLPKSPAGHKVKLITRPSRALAAEPTEYDTEEVSRTVHSLVTSRLPC